MFNVAPPSGLSKPWRAGRQFWRQTHGSRPVMVRAELVASRCWRIVHQRLARCMRPVGGHQFFSRAFGVFAEVERVESWRCQLSNVLIGQQQQGGPGEDLPRMRYRLPSRSLFRGPSTSPNRGSSPFCQIGPGRISGQTTSLTHHYDLFLGRPYLGLVGVSVGPKPFLGYPYFDASLSPLPPPQTKRHQTHGAQFLSGLPLNTKIHQGSGPFCLLLR